MTSQWQSTVVDYIQPNFAGFCQFCGYFQSAPASLLSQVNLAGTLPGVPAGLQQQFYTFNLNSLINYQQSPAALSGRDTVLGLPAGTSAANLANVTATQGGYIGIVQPSSFTVNERALSAYAEANFGGAFLDGKWGVDAGLRLVKTNTRATGSASTLLALGQTTPSQYTPTLGSAGIISRSNSYTKLLPTLNLTLSPTRRFTARLAFSQTFSRPELADLAPRFSFGDMRPGSFTATSGNTDLKPFTSTNFDASFEYYFNLLTFLTVAPFYKRVTDFIVQQEVTETITVPGGINVNVADPAINTANKTVQFLVTAPENAQKATVKGVEIAAEVGFSFLPGVLRHTGVSGNMTFVSSNAGINSGAAVNTVFALPGLSNTQNVSFFYDDGRLDGRIAYSRRSAFLETLVNPKAGIGPVFDAPYAQVDFRVTYQLPFLHDAIGVYVEGTNVFNEKIRKYGQYANQFLEYEVTGPRYAIGARYKF